MYRKDVKDVQENTRDIRKVKEYTGKMLKTYRKDKRIMGKYQGSSGRI